MPTTIQIIDTARALVARLEAAGGETDAATEAAIVSLVEEAESKAEALLAVMSSVDSNCDHARAIEVIAAARRKRLEAFRGRLEGLLREVLTARELATGESKAATPLGTAYLIRTQRVDGPESADAWPDGYRETRTEIRPARAAALRDLKAGAALPGLRLVESVSVGVRR